MSAGHPASRARGGVPSGGDDLDNLTRFEREWFAHLTRGELDQAAQALPEDYTFISSDGVLMGKTEGLDRLRETKFKNIRVENVSARRYGGVAVLVTRFQVRAMHGRRDMSGTYCHTRVYVLRAGEWTPVSGQSTRGEPRLGLLRGRKKEKTC